MDDKTNIELHEILINGTKDERKEAIKIIKKREDVTQGNMTRGAAISIMSRNNSHAIGSSMKK